MVALSNIPFNYRISKVMAVHIYSVSPNSRTIIQVLLSIDHNHPLIDEIHISIMFFNFIKKLFFEFCKFT